eukprot:gnl/TRDRNA2_/TRDRNA2_133587_c0_seq1.p1 gnl/TRDRNA2_/TRDRNA2_133587_c0~~gnl/TRDRNA2_/TRDRNA2_133587_c0_seq1.p1  ORF type:complete len:219 (-),score=49.02 gnl/TRDRNA2_/TRDRNA2_133587_c0_seq1:49-705(-)
MLSTGAVCKLIDFGTAKDLENPHIKGSGNRSRSKVFEDYVGTPQFMPPEVIENKFTDQRSDTWSFGGLIYQVLVGCPPYHGGSEYLIYTQILEHELKIPPGLTDHARDLITRMMVKDPDQRLGANDINELKAHAWWSDLKFEGLHKQPPPVNSLVDVCLFKIGKCVKEFQAQKRLEESDLKSRALGGMGLRPEILGRIEKIKLAHQWQEDCLPPDADE